MDDYADLMALKLKQQVYERLDKFTAKEQLEYDIRQFRWKNSLTFYCYEYGQLELPQLHYPNIADLTANY